MPKLIRWITLIIFKLEIPIVNPFVEVAELKHFTFKLLILILIIKMKNLTEQDISLKEQELTLKI